MLKKFLSLCLLGGMVAGLAAGLFVYRAKTLRGEYRGERVFRIAEGEDIQSVAKRLEADRLVSSRWYFLWSAFRGNLRGKVPSGSIVISGNLTAPEVVATLLQKSGKPEEVTLTFPEGWTIEKMASRLSANEFDGDKFVELARNPLPEWREAYPILASLPENASLEGFLFPDTYTFAIRESPGSILEKMLGNFSRRFSDDLRKEADQQGKTVFETVTFASILEREIGNANQSAEAIERDRRMVSDLFWRRLRDNHALESDATLEYARGESKVQHSIEETRFDSPYNTYRYRGLPPGPISNPGLASLRATLFPLSNPYYFFLNNPKTGETFFAVTFEEHKHNKVKNGL